VASSYKLLDTQDDSRFQGNDTLNGAIKGYGYLTSAVGLHDAFAKGDSKQIALATVNATVMCNLKAWGSVAANDSTDQQAA
jgi:hypothetical protein